jgi:hypothetical protein
MLDPGQRGFGSGPHPSVSADGEWVAPELEFGYNVPSAGGFAHPTVDAEGRWVSDDRNPEARSLDEGFTASAPGGVRQPWEFQPPSGSESYFGAPGDLWSGMVDWWFSHDIPTEGLPSGGGLMIGPQEMAKLGNFLKDALLPLMAGDIGLAGVGGLGPFDPLPIPAGKVIGEGVKGAKAGVRAARRVVGDLTDWVSGVRMADHIDEGAEMWHVTRSKDLVEKEGFREGVSEGFGFHTAVGPKGVSVTYSRETAESLAEQIEVAARAARGAATKDEVLDVLLRAADDDVSIEDLVDDMVRNYSEGMSDIDFGDTFDPFLDELSAEDLIRVFDADAFVFYEEVADALTRIEEARWSDLLASTDEVIEGRGLGWRVMALTADRANYAAIKSDQVAVLQVASSGKPLAGDVWGQELRFAADDLETVTAAGGVARETGEATVRGAVDVPVWYEPEKVHPRTGKVTEPAQFHTPVFDDAHTVESGGLIVYADDLDALQAKVEAHYGRPVLLEAADDEVEAAGKEFFARQVEPTAGGVARETGETAGRLSPMAPRSSATVREGDYFYHATTRESLDDIADGGLDVGRPEDSLVWADEPQQVWPDGADEARSYWADTEAGTIPFSQPGAAVLRVRAKDAPGIRAERGTTDFYTTDAVSASRLEYLADDGSWKPVAASGVARETGEAVARTDAEARAVIKSLEEKAAPAASGVVDKPMWHGSSQRFDTFSAGHGDERALFGLGVYTTDDMSVAVGYSQKRPISAATQIVARSDTPAGRALDEAVAGGAEREGYVYNVVWRGKNPPRVLDLEATMPDEVRGIARSIVDSLDDSVLTAEVPLDDWEELVSIVGDPASTFEDFYRKLVRVFTESGQPSTEFIDILQEMSDDLVEAGVDAFRYTGGKRVGKGHLHEAMVWLDSESVEVVQAGNIEGLFRNTGG